MLWQNQHVLLADPTYSLNLEKGLRRIAHAQRHSPPREEKSNRHHDTTDSEDQQMPPTFGRNSSEATYLSLHPFLAIFFILAFSCAPSAAGAANGGTGLPSSITHDKVSVVPTTALVPAT